MGKKVDELFDWEAERQEARDVVNNMEKRGKIVRSSFCWVCGRFAETEMHHGLYEKPKCVVHVCRSCHRIADRLRQAREEGRPVDFKGIFDWEKASMGLS